MFQCFISKFEVLFYTFIGCSGWLDPIEYSKLIERVAQLETFVLTQSSKDYSQAADSRGAGLAFYDRTGAESPDVSMS